MKEFGRKKLPSFLLVILMLATMVPTASAASADVAYEVDAGDKVTFDVADFSVLKTFDYLEFTDYSDLDSYGYFTAYNQGGDKVTLDEDDLDNMWFYYDEDDIDYGSDCDLDTLTFVVDNDADGTLTLGFELYKTSSASPRYSGTLKIVIDGDGTSSADSIVYEVEAGEKTTFDAGDFYDFFDENYTSSYYNLRYVVFDKPTSTALSEGTLYYNYGKSSAVEFTRTSFANATFYYDDDSCGDYPLSKLSFVADDAFEDDVELTFTAYYSSSKYVKGTLILSADGSSSSSSVDGDITYSVEENDDVTFDPDDFEEFFAETYSSGFSYIRFTDISNLDECGVLTTYINDDDEWESVELDEDDALDGYFYYDDDDVKDKADYYCLDGLGFEADDDTDGEVVALDFTAYGTTSSKKVYGTLVIEIGDVDSSSSSKVDIEYKAAPEEEVAFDEEDFNDFFQDTYSSYDFKYLVFTGSENLGTYNGFMYYNYGRSSQVQFSSNTLKSAYFYYDEDDIPEDDDDCYPLEDLSFVASQYFDTAVSLDFTAYYSNSRKVSGTVVISPEDKENTATASATSSILYTTTYGTNVQLKANDFARFYESKVSNSTFQSVKLLGVPSTGGLYYNYYSASAYGTSSRLQLTAYNCGTQPLYLSPANTTQYALSELTYIPYGTNYCASIPFAASGTGGYTVYGSVMISVTNKAIPEVYGVTPKNTAVSFPSPSIVTAVSTGTSSTLAGIQLLSLPASSVGSVYVGTGTTRKATTSELYTVSSGAWTISQLRFVPATGYTGNVEIPYAAYDSTGKIIGAGKFSLGVVNSQKKFTDVTSSTWCYKYVAELSDANVISGYTNGTFKPDSTISYGAALKLIMLAAGYGEQTPTVAGSTFSGYLAKAQSEGIITRTNVNLSAPITRLQVAQLAAGALKLDLNNLSSVKPFTDTTDKHVQALNAAGIVEGYFSGGTSTFKPNNTLTRGQVSAIVWRMQNYK